MKTLHISVINKMATYTKRDGVIVCGNSDYQVEFAFDSEWDAHEEKTARFIWNGSHKDVKFTGSICPVPVVTKAQELLVGVYAGELETTTAAAIPCLWSILCVDTTEGAPPSVPCYDIVQETGDRADLIMSQKATTEELEKKLDAVTATDPNYRFYMVDNTGKQCTRRMDSGGAGTFYVPIYWGETVGAHANGKGFLVTSVPVLPYQAANKKYVDDIVASLVAEIAALEERVAALESGDIGPTLPEFTWVDPYGGSDPLTFNFEEGMTWADFINSPYNVDGYFMYNEYDGVYATNYGPFGPLPGDIVEAKQYPY